MKRSEHDHNSGSTYTSIYWRVEEVINRATNNKSHPKWGSRVIEIDTDEWTCQACGTIQREGLPKYLVPLDDTLGEFFKICSNCKHIQFVHKIDYIHQLIRLVRV
jgi:hypothetical protein